MFADGARATAEQPDGGAPDSGDAPAARRRRFSPGEASASFAVARGVLPTSGPGLTAVVGAGLIATAAVVAGHHSRPQLPPSLQAALDITSSASLGGWLVTAMLLTIGAVCAVIYGLRSSRTDDVRGRYRWWLCAAGACVVASAVHSAGLAGVMTGEVQRMTGFSATAAVFCWLSPVLLLVGVVAVRTLPDVAESPWSLALTTLSAASLLTAAAASLGVLPVVGGAEPGLTVGCGVLAGLTLTLGAQLAYVRRVLLETDGVVAAPRRRQPVAKAEAGATEPAPSERAKRVEVSPPAPAAKPERTAPTPARPSGPPQPVAVKLSAATVDSSRWTDGSDGPVGEDEGGTRRKLSKAERKQLRKDKAGRYAA